MTSFENDTIEFVPEDEPDDEVDPLLLPPLPLDEEQPTEPPTKQAEATATAREVRRSPVWCITSSFRGAP
jgi:hypothetical protein